MTRDDTVTRDGLDRIRASRRRCGVSCELRYATGTSRLRAFGALAPVRSEGETSEVYWGSYSFAFGPVLALQQREIQWAAQGVGVCRRLGRWLGFPHHTRSIGGGVPFPHATRRHRAGIAVTAPHQGIVRPATLRNSSMNFAVCAVTLELRTPIS